ncbi:MAG: anaerobic glycerol-3-phosphate dehydrogenase subunit GlpB [Prevotella sp.]|jgi:glycerol-3-phosphate dehydrogenase subunit B
MKYDNIIIGGGLAGMTCGIALQKAGQRTAVIAAGQSTLHFSSGSIDLLGYTEDGKTVDNPIEAASGLSAGHPYHRVTDLEQKAQRAAELLADAGLKMNGELHRNHFRFSPMGVLKPTWLTPDGMFTTSETGQFRWKSVALISLRGFLDIPTEFLADNLKKMGVEVERREVSTPALDVVRRSPSEMRSTNLAKALDNDERVEALAEAVNALEVKSDLLLLPAVLGFRNQKRASQLRTSIKKESRFVVTMPPTVPGVCLQSMLNRRFTDLGGTLFQSDTVKGGTFSVNRLESVVTENLSDEVLQARNFVLCTGSFQSRGIMSNYQGVYEPIFHLDVDAAADRSQWVADYFFDDQPYMKFGVRTDEQLHPLLNGKSVENLWAAGSVLSGHNPVKLADRGGVDMMTALQTVEYILARR